MNKRNFEFKIGIMVLTVIVVLVLLVFQFGRHSLVGFGAGYEINVHFENGPGINVDTPVYKSGVKIGAVRSVNLIDDETYNYVDVVLQINKDRKIFSNEACRINVPLISMTGTTLEIVKMRDYPGPVLKLEPGQTIPGIIPVDMMQSFGSLEGDFTKTIQNIGDAAEKVTRFVENTLAFFGDDEEMKEKQERLQVIVEQANLTMETIQRLAENVNAIFEDDNVSESIRRIAKTVPDTMDQAQIVLENINAFAIEARTTFSQANGMIDRFSSNLGNLENFTSALDMDGVDMIKSLSRASRRVEGVFDDIAMLTSALQNPKGSLGQLMSNPELYESIRNTVENFEGLSQSLRPIMNDMRIFSDKVARDPGVLGVRGALSPNPPLKGLPFGDGTDSDGLFTKRRDKISPTHAIITASYTPYPGEEPFEQQRWKAQLLPQKSYGLLNKGPEFEYVPIRSPLQKAYSSVRNRQSQNGYADDLDGSYYEGMPGMYSTGLCSINSGSVDYFNNGEFWNGQEIMIGDEMAGQWSPSPYGESIDGFHFGENDFSENEISENGYLMSGNDVSTDWGMGPQSQQMQPAPQIGAPVNPRRSSVAPVPGFGPQPRQQNSGDVPRMPTTILEFRSDGTMIEGTTGEVIESMGPTSFIPDNNPGVTFPTRDRGYIIEFETGLPNLAPQHSAVVHHSTPVQRNPVVFPPEIQNNGQTTIQTVQQQQQPTIANSNTGITKTLPLQRYGSLKNIYSK